MVRLIQAPRDLNSRFFLSPCIVLGIQTEANDDRIRYFTRIITSNALLPLKLAWWGPI